MKKLIMLYSALICTLVQGQSPTIVFNAPGNYQLGSDIIIEPTDDNQSAISIETSYIILDLGGRTISMDPTTTNVGILVLALHQISLML